MRAVEAEYKCRLHKLTLTDRQTLTQAEPGVSREAPPLKNSLYSIIIIMIMTVNQLSKMYTYRGR